MEKKYNVFLKRDSEGAFEGTLLLRTGFNIEVFLMQSFLCLFVYFFYKKMWKEGGILFLITICLVPIYLINFSFAIFVGFKYSDFMTKKLVKNNYEYLGYSYGNNIDEARKKFLKSFEIKE